jgi:hypothetical protein
MPGSKDPLPFPRHTRRIQLQLHQLVHVLQGQHVAVELHDALILDQAKRRQLRPAVVESRVVRVVDVDSGQQVLDALLWDAAGFERGASLGREGVGVEGYEGIFRAVGFEGVVEGEEPGEVRGVRYESCPDCFILGFFFLS